MTPTTGRGTYIFFGVYFAENCMKLKEIGPGGVASVPWMESGKLVSNNTSVHRIIVRMNAHSNKNEFQ